VAIAQVSISDFRFRPNAPAHRRRGSDVRCRRLCAPIMGALQIFHSDVASMGYMIRVPGNHVSFSTRHAITLADAPVSLKLENAPKKLILKADFACFLFVTHCCSRITRRQSPIGSPPILRSKLPRVSSINSTTMLTMTETASVRRRFMI
jgi:hypothetical protein